MNANLSLPTTTPGQSTCQGGCAGCGCSSNRDSNATATAQVTSQDTRASNINAVESSSPGPVGDALLESPENVLSTLSKDGKRNWLRPKLSKGNLWRYRRIVAYVLMVIFIIVPHLRIGGRPLIQLDVLAREFTILGHTFLPTDTLLLALLLLTAFVGIFFTTAVTGRAWCGWACPQTVYIEYLFRPIDRLFEGTVGKGGNPKHKLSTGMEVLRFLVYLALTSVLAHTFLAYFVGTENLARWLTGSPLEHPVAFIVMAVTTGLLTYDFYYFREQTCMIACPYGRFQSVMLDKQSLIVAYDHRRGEPRRKGKHAPGDGSGDCVDCNQCVVVCPTGIDIRDGLQMECINCTQCIDACNDVMKKVHKPEGLIRFTSQEALEGKQWKYWRPRTIIYPTVLLILISGFFLAASTKYSFDARIIRGKGAPFTVLSPRVVSNSFHLRLVNRSEQDQQYELSIDDPTFELEVIEPQTLQLKNGETNLVPIQIRFPSYVTAGDGNEPIEILVQDQSDNRRAVGFKVLGPR